MPRRIIVGACRHLPATLRLDIGVAQLPGICRRHNGSIRYLMDILPHRIETGLYGKIICKGITCRHSEFRSVIGLDDLSIPRRDRIRHRRHGGQYTFLICIVSARSQSIEHGIAYTRIDGEPGSYIPFIPYINGTFQCFILLQFIISYQRIRPHRLVGPGIHIIQLAHQTEVHRMAIAGLIKKVRFSKPLVNGKRQPCGRRFLHRFIISVIVVVITEREVSGQLFCKDGPPVCREIHIVVGILLIVIKGKTVVTIIAIDIQLVALVHRMREDSPQIIETGFPITIPAFVGQCLHYPVRIGRTSTQQKGSLFLNDGNLEIQLTGHKPDTCRTGKLFLVRLLAGDVQYGSDTPAILAGDTALIKFRILYHVRIKSREKTEKMIGVINRSVIEKKQVLVSGTPTHIVTA